MHTRESVQECRRRDSNIKQQRHLEESVVCAMFDTRETDPFALECSPAQADAEALDVGFARCCVSRVIFASTCPLLPQGLTITMLLAALHVLRSLQRLCQENPAQDLALEVGSELFVQTVQAQSLRAYQGSVHFAWFHPFQLHCRACMDKAP